MNSRSFVSMSVFLILMGTALTGIVRFLDETPVVATFHMTFAFTLIGVVYFHIYNNWNKLWKYICTNRNELFMAVGLFLIICLVAFSLHYFSIASEVI